MILSNVWNCFCNILEQTQHVVFFFCNHYSLFSFDSSFFWIQLKNIKLTLHLKEEKRQIYCSVFFFLFFQRNHAPSSIILFQSNNILISFWDVIHMDWWIDFIHMLQIEIINSIWISLQHVHCTWQRIQLMIFCCKKKKSWKH